MKAIKLFIRTVGLVVVVAVGLISIIGKGGTPPPPPPTVTLPDKLKACIVGKTIKISGVYGTSTGIAIDINREAQISEDLFKIKEQGEDELPEDSKITAWKGNLLEVVQDGTEGEGITKSSLFAGPDGTCVFEASARICEDSCTIEDAMWQLRCNVKPDGTGGSVKARGSWEVVESQ
jgi:hypothetical protein